MNCEEAHKVREKELEGWNASYEVPLGKQTQYERLKTKFYELLLPSHY